MMQARPAAVMFLAALLALPAAGAEEEWKGLPRRVRDARVDRELTAFIPAGYRLLDQARGDLDRDGRPDRLVALWRDDEGAFGEEPRPLLLLLRGKDGRLALAARNDGALLSAGDGGVHGDPYHGMGIRDGAFTLEHFGGSGWRWNHVATFEYDPALRHWLLRSLRNDVWHIGAPAQVERHGRTARDFGLVRFVDYRRDR